MKKFYLCFLFIGLMNTCIATYSLATKPGAQLEVIESKDLIVDLYLIGLEFSSDQEIKGAHFAWLPSQVKEECLNQTYDECRRYYHENYQIEKDTQGRTGFAKKSFLEKIFKEYPDQVLAEWLTDDISHDDQRLLLNEFSKIPIIANLTKDGNKSQNFPIMKDKKMKAKIHWELWPNGQNFKIIKFIR